MTDTTHYAWERPVVNASADTWGDTINATLEAIDGQVFDNAAAAAVATNLTSGTVANARLPVLIASLAGQAGTAGNFPYLSGANTFGMSPITTYTRSPAG
jgi:hypothetical protein